MIVANMAQEFIPWFSGAMLASFIVCKAWAAFIGSGKPRREASDLER